MSPDLIPFERADLELFLVLGHEIASTALTLNADYVSAQLPLGPAEIVMFSYDRGVVSVTGRGFDVELSCLREW
jgi:hypothetical protein